ADSAAAATNSNQRPRSGRLQGSSPRGNSRERIPALRNQLKQAAAQRTPSADSAAASTRTPSAQVVREGDEGQEQDQAEADERDALVDLARDGAAADALDHREEDVAAVEREERQQVEERERHAHETH